MSESQKIAAKASEYIDSMIEEILEGDYPDNHLLLGSVISGDKVMQIQLVVAAIPELFMDET